MKLTIAERIVLGGILPAENNFVTLKIIRKLRDALSFSEEELKKFGIKTEETRVTWSEKFATEETEIEIGEKATDVVVEALKKLDEEKKLANQHFSIYEKFMDKKKEE